MDFLIRDAYAQGGGGGGGPGELIFIVVIFAVFYFLLIRPQQKRAKEHRLLVEALSKGDEVVTNGGLLGKVSEVGESFITVDIAENTSVHVQRMSVSAVMPKGTIKSL